MEDFVITPLIKPDKSDPISYLGFAIDIIGRACVWLLLSPLIIIMLPFILWSLILEIKEGK